MDCYLFLRYRVFSGPPLEEVVHGTTLSFCIKSLNGVREGRTVAPDTYRVWLMKLKKMMALAIAVVGLSSCESWHDVTTVRTAEAETGLLVHPMVIELDSVSTHMIVDTIRFTDKTYSDEDKPALYSEAMAKCIQKHHFDLLVSPSYQMYCETTYSNSSYSSNITSSTSYNVVISGYPAYFKRIRPATPEDGWMIPFYNRTAHIEMNSIQRSEQSVTK